MLDSLASRAQHAAKWSLLTEAIAKAVMPVTQLALVRILAPEAFGILATVVMISSFAEMISDAGFRNYLIQHDFQDQAGLYRAADVAFWTSLVIAIALLAVIATVRDELAAIVGNPGLGIPIAIASLSLPMSVFVSTQLALFRRAFEYKKLLPIRVLVAIIPLCVSVPLALNGFGFWSLIVGMLAAAFVNAVVITIASPWKPSFFYSLPLLRKMLSFSTWSLLEAISIWASLWAGTFIAGRVLTPHELGLYREPIIVVNSAFALVTTATTPILFAALSRLQSDRIEYRRFFLRFQFAVAIAILPIGVGAFFYRNFFTDLLFGSQWSDAALMFGSWALSTSLAIIFSHYCSEVFRSLGKPRISFLSQCIYLAVMTPVLYFAALQGYPTLVVVSSIIRLVQVAINQVLTWLIAGIGLLRVIRNLAAPILAAAVMGPVAEWSASATGDSWWWSLMGVLACAVLYALAILCFPRSRALVVAPVVATLRRPA